MQIPALGCQTGQDLTSAPLLHCNKYVRKPIAAQQNTFESRGGAILVGLTE